MLLSLLAVLTVVALSTPFLDRVLGRATGWPVAAVFALSTGLVLSQGHRLFAQGQTLESALPWMPTIGVGLYLRMDGLAWLFCVIVLGVGALVMAYSARYFPPGRRTGFFFLMSLFTMTMTGLVLADDLVLLFVFWELTTICSFYLIGLSGPDASRPAIRTYLLTAMGGLALLAAVVLLWTRTGTTRVSEVLDDTSWTQDGGFTTVVALLVIVAVLTKSAQFPFHYWLPDAMAASTPVSAYLHAAAMVKAGVYLAMRFSPAFGELAVWNTVLVCLGLVTAVLGAVFALQKHDLKELTAYSTVGQLGLLVAVIGVGTPQALIAAGVHTLAHALFKSALFMVVGVVEHQTGSRDLRELGGLRRAMPVTAAVSALAALSMAGVPPLLGFVTKENLFEAMLETPGPAWSGPVAGAVAVAAAALTFAYAFRFVHLTFGGRPDGGAGTGESPVEEAGWAFLAAPMISSVAGLVLGLFVTTLNPVAGRVGTDATHVEAEPHLALWHGLNPALGMSAMTILLGALLAWRTRAGGTWAGRRLFPVPGTTVFERLHAGVVALGVRTGDLTRTDSPTRHLAVPLVMVVLLSVVVSFSGLEYGARPAPASLSLDWVLVALVAASVVAAVTTLSRMAALALVGVAGFTTALWFVLLGAFDVALTQFLVEVLTVVVAVLVLRRLPRGFHRVRRSRTVASAVVAVAAGCAAGSAAYLFTGRRELSSVSEYFLSNAQEDTGGTNVVNTILVDYRAMDTLGELTVLGAAGLIIVAVLNSAGLTAKGGARLSVRRTNPVWDTDDNTVIMRTVARWLIPLLVLWSAYLLLRGHNAAGGGFIAGLVGGSAFALAYLTAPSASVARIQVSYTITLAAGVAVAVGAGLLGYVDGSFLRPLHADVPLPWGGHFHFTTALVFDVGVYLAVVGVLLSALNQLGLEPPGQSSGEHLGREDEPREPTHDSSSAGGAR
ncbi:DUF4040 family protein [Nocardiopsis sp. ATB16-24]|uniref:DUF4040 family protein n=1 Tax=Nocardiopsis sp. ATB16-24 TaxID=3019555 RepID=UPI00255791F1|nr:DUF4040 family protein [Nocardiopsis sp. ATB16-24]